MKSLLALAAVLFFQEARGHGGVYNYTIDDVDYAGSYPWLLEDGQNTIQRRWWPDPIQDVNHPYLACNRGNPLATHNPTLHAPVRAGGTVRASYFPPPCPEGFNQPTEPSVPGDVDPPMKCSGPEYPWVHSQGPVMIYMADCGGPCDKFDAQGKVWFKIAESGLHGPGNDLGSSSSGWSQWNITHIGWNITIPPNLKPGNYLIRHEILMIELWPPQFYPECAQLTVSGTGDAVPSDDYLVSFPGAYSFDDPGIAVSGTIYTPQGHSTFNYTIPGPPVWTGGD